MTQAQETTNECHHRAPIGAVVDKTSDPDGFIRSVHFEPGYVCDVPRMHGRHGMQLRFVLASEFGAVQFLLYLSDWLPGSVDVIGNIDGRHGTMSADLGHHWPTPTYDGEIAAGACEYLAGAECFYDGSGLNAASVLSTLVTDGIEAMWDEMKTYWHHCNASARTLGGVA